MKILLLFIISFGFFGVAQIQIVATTNVGYVIEEIK